MKRIVTILFFVVVFGLPIGWYLFLQAFGENKFDLPNLGNWENSCVVESATLLVDSAAVKKYPNEYKRLKKGLSDQTILTLYEFSKSSCDIMPEAVLIDHMGKIRGQYVINREEVDRILAETDIYILNYTNEVNKQPQ